MATSGCATVIQSKYDKTLLCHHRAPKADIVTPGIAYDLLPRPTGNVEDRRVVPRRVEVQGLHHPCIQVHALMCLDREKLERIGLERSHVTREVVADAANLASVRVEQRMAWRCSVIR